MPKPDDKEQAQRDLEKLREKPKHYARASARILDKLTREKERRPPYAIT